MWLMPNEEKARGGREDLSQGRLPRAEPSGRGNECGFPPEGGWEVFGDFSARGAMVWFSF